jgi:truncated hemoglobin YjbI
METEPTVFEWAGGMPALVRLTTIFYAKYVPEDPLLAPRFANMSADHPQRVASWLGEVFGGPKVYSEHYGGYHHMLSQHLGKNLTEDERARWVSLLMRSATDAGLPNDPEFRSVFAAYIAWGSRIAAENSRDGANPPEEMPMPHWDWHTSAGAPGSRAAAAPESADPARPEAGTVVPAANDKVSYTVHLKPLFRLVDQQSMKWAFDLWSYEDVVSHADKIWTRISGGTMPPDGAWPAERVEILRRWIADGKLE